MKGMPAWIVCVLLLLAGLYNDGIPWKFMRMFKREESPERHALTIPFYMRQVSYNVSAVSVAKPTNQSGGMVLHEMSVVVKNSNLTQNVSDTIILCLANRTHTSIKDWGLYNHSKFSNTLIQAEYYAYCERPRTLMFRTNITEYLTDKELTMCVKKVTPGQFASGVAGATPDIVYARNIVESIPNGKHHEGGIAAWIVGAVVGVILLSAVIVSVILMIKRVRVYEPVAYEAESNWGDVELSEGGKARAEFEKNIKAITVGYD